MSAALIFTCPLCRTIVDYSCMCPVTPPVAELVGHGTVEAAKASIRPIVTSHVYPPIPIRSHDWCAHYDGEEEVGNYGWGATEAEAIQDFKDNCQADHDERLA